MSVAPEDTLAILELVTRADDRAGARDAQGYAALFTDDAVMDGSMGAAHGRAQLAAAVAEVWAREPAGTLHLTLNPLVDDTDPEPTVRSVMLMVAGVSVVGTARVTQTVRRTDAGWRISERRIAAG